MFLNDQAHNSIIKLFFFSRANPFKQRGASLYTSSLPSLPSLPSSSQAILRSARQSGSFRRPSSLDRRPVSPVRFLLSRRQLFHDDAQTGSSETVVVKSLLPLSRPARDPQIHRFRLQDADAEVFRGSVEDQPRAAALIAPVQNILPEPIPAVPSFPVRNNFQTFSTLLQAVPAVPEPVQAVPDAEAFSQDTSLSRAVAMLRSRQRVQSPTIQTPSLPQRVPSSPSFPQRRPSQAPTFSSTRSSGGLGRDGPREEQPRTSNGLTTPFGRDKEVLLPTLARDEGQTTPLGREVQATTTRNIQSTTVSSRDTGRTTNRFRGLFGGRGTTPEPRLPPVTVRRPQETRIPPVTTRRPQGTLSKVLESNKRGEIVQHPELG